MGIEPRFKKADIIRAFEEHRIKVEQAIIARMIYVGETFVRNARNNGGYKDRTGNLRSSVGFVVFNNGKSVHTFLEKANRGTGGAEGVTKAKTLIAELKANYPVGICLIVVAGMDYAAAVESRGKDVLTSSSIEAKNQLKKAIKDLKTNIRNQ